MHRLPRPSPVEVFFRQASVANGLNARMLRRPDQTATLKTRPTPAVMAMANAPQKTTRTTERPMGAPPVLAPRAPSTAKPIKAEPATQTTKLDMGAMAATTKGRAAPAEKVMAEVIAAWMGRAVVISEMPSSSLA